MKTFTLLALALSTSLATACTDPGDPDGDASGTTSSASTNRPRFDLVKDTAGYHFTFLSTEGHTLMTSQAYASRTAALTGVLAVLDNGEKDAQYVVRDAPDGGSTFDLVAGNRQVIASSPLFADDTGAHVAVTTTEHAVSAYIQKWDEQTGARFDVFQGADGRFYFDLHAKNGAIVLASQGYSGEAAALNGAFAVAENGVVSARYLIAQTADGRWYWNLTSGANGQVIGTSQPYATKAAAQRGRDAVIALLPTVSIL